MANSDMTDALELLLFAQNDGWLFERYVKQLENELLKDLLRDEYVHTHAVKQWRRIVDAAAKRYMEVLGLEDHYTRRFDAPTLEQAAIEWACQYYGEMEERVDGDKYGRYEFEKEA